MTTPPRLFDRVRIVGGHWAGRVGSVSRVALDLVSNLWIITVDIGGGRMLQPPENLEAASGTSPDGQVVSSEGVVE